MTPLPQLQDQEDYLYIELSRIILIYFCWQAVLSSAAGQKEKSEGQVTGGQSAAGVVTTGATMEACAQLLSRIPDIRLSAAAVAFSGR